MNTRMKRVYPDFFIVGLQKSGSYWISALLDVHPQIRCLPTHYMHNITKGATGADEGRIFDMFASVENDGGAALKNSLEHHHGGFFKNIVPLIDEKNREKLEEALKQRYCEWFAYHNKENKPIVGDKTTEYVFHLDLIDRWYPKAKKVCIIRDPKDRVVSWHFHQIRRGRKSQYENITNDFIKDYLKNQIQKEYECMLAYGGRIQCVSYEDLSREPVKQLEAIVSYLGGMISDDILETMVREASLENLRKKDEVYKDGRRKKREVEVIMSHYRKGVVGDFRNYLSDAHIQLIDERVGPLHKKVCEKYGI